MKLLTGLLISLCLGSTAFAKGGSKGLYWASLGAGNPTITKPQDTSDILQKAFFNFGAELQLGGSPFVVGIAAEYSLLNGSFDYNYTSPSSVTYTATDEKFWGSTYALEGGAKIRIINTKNFHLYGGAGGVFTNLKLNYDAVKLQPQGADYKKSNDTLVTYGYYYEAGIDFIPYAYGIRIAARYDHQESTAIEEFQNKKLIIENVVGSIGLIKGF